MDEIELNPIGNKYSPMLAEEGFKQQHNFVTKRHLAVVTIVLLMLVIIFLVYYFKIENVREANFDETDEQPVYQKHSQLLLVRFLVNY